MSGHKTDMYTLYNQHPMVHLAEYQAKYSLQGELLAYLNYNGPTLSAKDTLAKGMLSIAKEKGLLQQNQPVVEVSSGTFAIALTIAAIQMGHPVHLVIPATTSLARQQTLTDLGAKIIFANHNTDILANISKAKKLAEQVSGYFVNYLFNDDNPEFHRKNTGPAILEAVQNEVDTLIIGVGSGGTLTGVAEYVKAWLSDVWVVAVQPVENQVLTGGFPGAHGIPGIGLNFIPDNYNPYVVDEVVSVPTGDALTAASELLQLQAIPACASAGAVLCAAKKVQAQRAGKTVCVFNGMKIYE